MTLITCRVHGTHGILHVSKDLAVAQPCEPRSEEIVDIVYMYRGRAADVFFVSRRFADEHGLYAGVSELPDDYGGEWVHEIACCCPKCFEEVFGGYIDRDTFRWHRGK
jgi:hypothetical protein